MYSVKTLKTDSTSALNKAKPSIVSFFQPKLTVNAPGDEHEQEADSMADKIMRMQITPSPDTFFKPSISSTQRKCAACEEDDHVHRKESDGSEVRGNSELDSYIGALGSSGQSLPENSRRFFEPRFGQDFSNVRIHTDPVAAKSAQSINALAYTSGNNIVFNQNQFSPETGDGKKLLAHELTHVVQQSDTMICRQPGPPPPQQTPPPANQGVEFDPGPGFGKEYSIPSQDPGSTGPDSVTLQVSAREQVLFNVSGVDKDKKRVSPTAPWTEIDGRGPYEIDFVITGDAELDSAGSGTQTKNIPSLRADNVKVFVKNTWNGTSGITVKATMKDKAPAVASPDTGNVKDPDRVFTWALIKRTNACPTSLRRVSGPGNTWSRPPIQFTYLAFPDPSSSPRPHYKGQVVLERFGAITALGFTMDDLEPAYKTANPSLDTPDKVAADLFSSGGNGTFIFNELDAIGDAHTEFGITTPGPFKTTALDDADGVGWNLPQEYVCGSTVIGSYVISRRFTNARGKEIKKTS